MQQKILLALLLLGNCMLSIYARAALRRTPKIYNALITTDDNLTSSRAYPVIQPTIHETGIPHYPFGPYNAYGYYNPSVVRFGQPIVPGLVPNEQLPYPLPSAQFPPQLMQQPPPTVPQEQQQSEYETYPTALNPTAEPQELSEEAQPAPTITVDTKEKETENVQPAEPATQPPQPVLPPEEYQYKIQGPKYMPIEDDKPVEMPSDQLPITLNEYGLPPSLIPLQQHSLTRDSNSRLPSYVFNQHPLLPGFYDPLTGFRDQYLPPYEYSPITAQTYALASAMAAQRRLAAQNSAKTGSNHLPIEPVPKNYEKPSLANESNLLTLQPGSSNDEIVNDFEKIKNVSKIKNNAVPDVPPPPIPSGAKTKSSS